MVGLDVCVCVYVFFPFILDVKFDAFRFSNKNIVGGGVWYGIEACYDAPSAERQKPQKQRCNAHQMTRE